MAPLSTSPILWQFSSDVVLYVGHSISRWVVFELTLTMYALIIHSTGSEGGKNLMAFGGSGSLGSAGSGYTRNVP